MFFIFFFKSNSDCSFDDTNSSLQGIFSCHNYLSLSCSFPNFKIFKIKKFTILVSMNQDKGLFLMKKHIGYFISFLEFNSLDSSSRLSHRSQVTTLEEKHPSLLSNDSYIIGIIDCLHRNNFFFECKFHNHRRKFFER